jgi:chromosome segregation ATPase
MSRNTIDTRDLYKRQQELNDLKTAVGSAEEELQEAQDALAAHAVSGEGFTDEDKEAHDEQAEELQTAVDEAEAEHRRALEDFGDDEQTELEELDNLESEISDWQHGESMIPEDEFEDYARQFAEDIGGTKDDVWPYTCIDWEKAAEELSQDYSTVSYQGTDYYVRS